MIGTELVIGFIVSYILAALLLFLSYCMFPWGEFADAQGVFQDYTKLTEEDNRRSLFSATGFQSKIRSNDKNKPIGYNGVFYNRMIMLGNVFASTFDGVKRYFKFYALFLVALPLIFGFVVAEQVKAEIEDFLFLSNTSNGLSQQEKNGQVGIWISLLYFWVMLASNNFFFAHAFLNKLSYQKIYQLIPVQYAYKVYYLSALLGFAVLFLSTMILISSESNTYNDIIRSCIVAPWIFAFRYFYRGFSAVFDMWGIASLPGSRTFWFCFDKTMIFLVLYWLTSGNRLAQLITIIILAVTNIFPLFCWIFKFKSARVPVKDDANPRALQQAAYSIAKDAKKAATLFLEYPLYFRASRGGSKQYFWNFWKPWNMPLATFISTPSTEDNLYARMMSYYAVQDLAFFESTLGDFPAPLFQCLMPLCILGLPIHGISYCKGDQFTNIAKSKEEINGVITPNTGRSVGLSQLFQGTTFDRSVVIIDAPGVEISGFVLNQIFQPGRLEQYDIKEFHFIFKIETVRDLVLIGKTIVTLFNDEENGSTKPNIVILYTGGISSKYVKTSVRDALPSIKDEFFEMIVFEHRLSLSNLMLEKLVEHGEGNNIVTCIGSSHMVGQIRPKVRNFQNVVFEDFVYEPTPYLVPVQKTSSTLKIAGVEDTNEELEILPVDDGDV